MTHLVYELLSLTELLSSWMLQKKKSRSKMFLKEREFSGT